MKRLICSVLTFLMIITLCTGCVSNNKQDSIESSESEMQGELSGEITFWHSFTQGPRLEVIQKAANKFMEENPKVKINIETFSWNDFYNKWTTGLATGNLPDMIVYYWSTVPGGAEMYSKDGIIIPLKDLIERKNLNAKK